MRTFSRPHVLGLLLLATATLLPACGDKPATNEGDTDLTRAVVAWHAEQVHASYVASRKAAGEMEKAITALLAEPTQDRLEAAREAWVDARKVYAPTEAFRFREGPIDHSRDGFEGLMNAWPMDEAYVDYVEGQPTAGLMANVEVLPEITAERLVALNEKDGEENVATGWHTIEFLLWGQDQSADGPGTRPVADFADGAGATATRRRTYLREATALLLTHLDRLVEAWAPGKADNHRHHFVENLEPREALRRIVTGIGTLTVDELRGERIFVAYDTRDPENEQSCFSDTTHHDHMGNLLGIHGIWFGTLVGEDGPGLDELVAAADPAVAKDVAARFESALEAMKALPVPFDSAIQAADGSAERTAILTVIESLDALGEALAKAGKALDLEVNFEGAAEAEEPANG